jgi:hypothetical protein
MRHPPPAAYLLLPARNHRACFVKVLWSVTATGLSGNVIPGPRQRNTTQGTRFQRLIIRSRFKLPVDRGDSSVCRFFQQTLILQYSLSSKTSTGLTDITLKRSDNPKEAG